MKCRCLGYEKQLCVGAIWGTFDLVVFKVILESFDVLENFPTGVTFSTKHFPDIPCDKKVIKGYFFTGSQKVSW